MNDASLAFPLIDATARTLLHLVWQGGAIAALLALALRFLRRRTPEARYVVSVVALTLIALAAAVTFSAELTNAPSAPPLQAVPMDVPMDRTGTIGEAAVAGLMEVALPREDRAELIGLAQRFAPAVVALWFAGVFVFSLRLAVGYGRVAQLVRQAGEELESEWSAALRTLSERLGLKRRIRLLHSSRVEVPTVIGWFRPVILVPLSALTGLEPKQVETILAHELAHIRRHDYAVNLFQSLLETLFFYHPAVWWISGQIRIEREHCCDDLAIALCGDRWLYAAALTELEELRAVAQPSLAANGGSLLSRIRRIVGRDETQHVHPGWVAALAMTTFLAAATIAAPVREDASWRDNATGLFWPGESAAGHIATALAASRSLSSRQPIEPSEPPAQGVRIADEADPLALDGIRQIRLGLEDREISEPVIRVVPGSIRTEFSIGGETVRARSASPGFAFAYVVADAAMQENAGTTRQGETLTVEEERSSSKTSSVDGLTVEDLIELRSIGIDGKYVSEMRQLGYDLSLGELHGLRSVGVTPDYVRSLAAAGYGGLDAEELQALAAVGVNSEYITQLGKLGIRDLTAEDLTSLRAVGVSPAYIGEMRKLFGKDLDAEDLVRMRSVGVSAEFAAAMKAAGYAKLDAEGLVALRAVGVSAEYIAALRAAGYADASLDEIVAARSVGVSTKYLDEMARFGIRNLDLDEVVSLRAVGVVPSWIRGMAAAGYGDLDADEMQHLRAIGITPEYVQELRDAGLVDLSVDELSQLRSSGIDGSFIREMRDSRKR